MAILGPILADEQASERIGMSRTVLWITLWITQMSSVLELRRNAKEPPGAESRGLSLAVVALDLLHHYRELVPANDPGGD